MIGANVSVFSIGKAVGGGAVNLAPVITSSPVTTATASTAYSYQVQATDPEGGSLSYSLPTKPTGMTISGSGLVQWTPSSEGSDAVVVRVTDDRAAFTDQAYSIAVAPLPYLLDILVIGAGGGGGGWYYATGGGGAGGTQTQTQVTPPENTNFTVTIAAGGATRFNITGALKASNSTFEGSGLTNISATGGGGGEAQFFGPTYGSYSNGGCGGGAGINASTNGRSSGGTGSQGGDGGGSLYNNGARAAGGGGGDSEDGISAFISGSNTFAGRGGNGTTWLDNVRRAGGGGGAFGTTGSGTVLPGAGGLGGGGGGGATVNTGYVTNSSAGTANTGGGGGGGSTNVPSSVQAAGSNGGSGVTILRYAGGQRGTGGTITSSGGFTYHTFNSSGTFNTGS